MTAMRTLLFCLALAPSVLDAKKMEKARKVKPIITTDLVYSTAELFYDMYDDAREYITEKASPLVAPAVSSMSAQLPEDPLALLCAKVGLKKAVITENVANAQGALLHAKALVADVVAKAYEPLSLMVVGAVTAFENMMPRYTGLIPRNLGDFAVFMLYFMTVSYIIIRIALRILRIVFGIFRGVICCVFCCRCCRQRKAPAAKPAKGKASAKGKAAAASNAKPAEKNGKKH